MIGVNRQERSRQCYIPILIWIVYISFGVGYCLLSNQGSPELLEIRVPHNGNIR